MREAAKLAPLLLGGLVLTVAAIATRAQAPELIQVTGEIFPPPRESTHTQATPPTQPGPLPTSSALPVPRTDITPLAHGLLTIAAIAASIVIVALLIRVSARLRARSQAAPVNQHGAAHSRIDIDAISASLDKAQRELLASDHDSIVLAWLTLEDSIASAWRTRYPHETSHEFVHEAIRLAGAPSQASAALNDLYREAYYSQHDLGKDSRERAAAHLRSARDSLVTAHTEAST